MQNVARPPVSGLGRLALWALGAAVLGAAGCASSSPAYQNQRAFASPEQAVAALATAARSGDTAELEALFGPQGRAVLSSGDPVADRHGREVFVVAMDQGWRLQRIGGHTKELIVGHEQWPFPIPLEKDRHGWWFDTEAGETEVLARRIGRNELAAIGVLHTYVISQEQYAARGHDGRPAGIYAQKVKSDPGRHNGLYWPSEGPDDPASPLGAFAARAAAEGYSTAPGKDPTPFHGYFYRILTRQGPAAPGGAMSYIVDGDMTGGFALIATPAQYGNSGIMSFLVGPDGIVYEADLGAATATVAGAVSAYNPHDGWSVVE